MLGVLTLYLVSGIRHTDRRIERQYDVIDIEKKVLTLDFILSETSFNG